MTDQPPLDYRNYSDDRPERRKNIWAFIVGFVIGIVVISFGGFIAVLATFDEMPATTRPGSRSPIVAFFTCGAVASAISGFLVLRRQRRRFMLAGFLLGVALTCMIEGICFSG